MGKVTGTGAGRQTLQFRGHRPQAAGQGNFGAMSDSGSRPVAVVTGASSGIGEEFARQLAARGYDLVLVARRVDRLTDLAERIRKTHEVECVPYGSDLANPEARDHLCQALAPEKDRLEVLVNNAGF